MFVLGVFKDSHDPEKLTRAVQCQRTGNVVNQSKLPLGIRTLCRPPPQMSIKPQMRGVDTSRHVHSTHVSKSQTKEEYPAPSKSKGRLLCVAFPPTEPTQKSNPSQTNPGYRRANLHIFWQALSFPVILELGYPLSHTKGHLDTI